MPRTRSRLVIMRPPRVRIAAKARRTNHCAVDCGGLTAGIRLAFLHRPDARPSQLEREGIAMARKITTHLMFEGVAEEAMNFYVSLFGDSEINHLERYGPGEMGAEGTVKLATFT